MRLQDISVEAEIPAPTVMRLLNTLSKYGYVSQNSETLKYSLTLKFAQIGSLVRSQFNLNELVHPYLMTLSVDCGESACLAMESDMEVVYIDAVDGPDSMLKTMQRIGKRAPLHSTGVGKLMLLNYSPEQINQYVARKGLSALTSNTITTKEQLLEELNTVKSRNYALDNEECELGARCIAAPIRDYTGKVIASISVSGPVIRLTNEKLETIRGHVTRTAEQLSKIYAYDS